MTTRDVPGAAGARALDAIRAGIGAQGQWPSWVVGEPATDDGRRDISPPITALGMLALDGLPQAASLLAASRVHLERTVRPGGMWRYYADIPPDTDDSAMCALALGVDHPLASQTRATIAATVLTDGLFPTWYEPGWGPAVDAVANAHVVAVLGEGAVTASSIAWLTDVVGDAAEVESSHYYPDPLDLHVAIRRGVDRGVSGLRPALEMAQTRARRRLVDEQLTPYRTAQALAVLAGALDEGPRESAVSALLDAQQPSGQWIRETLFVAGRTDAPGRWLYQSWSVVTALCARAVLA